MLKVDNKKPFISGLVEGSIDSKVYQDVLKNYARETISFLEFGNLSVTNIDPKIIERVQYTECEISPFRHHEIPCKDTKPATFKRKASFNRFSTKKVDFDEIQNLLIHSFSPDEEGHRPYPSAGGLYPVEPIVILFEERINHNGSLQSGCYHFRPVSRSLQRIKTLDSKLFIESMFHGFVKPDNTPAFCILYVAHIGKSIFKYRYRGYRHAMMEAGSMYQQALYTAENMDLRTSVWSSFSEHQMMHELGLDYGSFMLLTTQLFGYGEAS